MISKGPSQPKPFYDAVTKLSHLLTYLLSQVKGFIDNFANELTLVIYLYLLVISSLMSRESWNENEQRNLVTMTQEIKLYNSIYKQG